MLCSILISPDAELAERLGDFLDEVGKIAIARVLTHYPDASELVRVVRSHAPQVVFLSMQSIAHASAVMASIEQHTPGMQFVAIHPTCDPQLLLEAMRLGVREFLAPPFSREAYYEMVARLEESLAKRPPQISSSDHVFAFLPAKPGVGASTIALNVAAAMARQPDTKVLLSDLDLNSGMVRFMLKLDNPYSILDAAEHAARLDENLWDPLVTSIDNLDVLHAGKLNPNIRIEALQLRHMLDFARRNYQAICFDLSGNLERYSIEVMHEAKRIYLVSTPEIPSLHLAREKLQYLETLELGGRVRVLINRAHKKSSITCEQIAQLLKAPVEMTFQNEYQAVQRALQDGKVVEPSSDLGKQFTHMAKLLIGKPSEAPAEPKKKLSEMFSARPGRFSLFSEDKKPAA